MATRHSSEAGGGSGSGRGCGAVHSGSTVDIHGFFPGLPTVASPSSSSREEEEEEEDAINITIKCAEQPYRKYYKYYECFPWIRTRWPAREEPMGIKGIFWEKPQHCVVDIRMALDV